MVHDAWLPVGYPLPDGEKTKFVLHEGADWQIVGTQGGGRALMAREVLARRWTDAGLVDAGHFASFTFGRETLREISFMKGGLAPVSDCGAPGSKGEAMAFAAAMKATRAIDPDSPLQDAIYVERLSRLLPTYTGTPGADDDILGCWLTGGTSVPATSFRRLGRSLNWLPAHAVKDIVLAAGFTVDENAPEDRPRRRTAARGDAADPGTPAPVDRKEAFCLPGRPGLEAFLREHVIDIVVNRARYRALGVGFPSAIVLHGPPGCGKTFAVARLVEYLGWPCFRIDASSVASPYIHDTSRKIAGMFQAAADSAPSVLVIDEMEAYLADRSSSIGASHHRVEEVAEFLRRIPEAAANDVLIVAMTNRLAMIDPAILRRGRFDHVIEVGPAVEEEIAALLTALLARLPREEDVNVAALARKLVGRPLSDVAFVVQEGARLAARAGLDRIGQAHLAAALKNAPAREEEPRRRLGFL
jgi:cell division protease FtsH